MENKYDWACRLRFSGEQRHVYGEDRENVFKTYRELIDEMGKVSLSHVKRRPRENRDFSRWPAEEKHEKVSKLTSEKFPGLKNHFSWVSFLRWQRW